MAPKKMGASKRSGSIVEKISNSEIVAQGRRAACDAAYVSKKLLWSTGKAAWFAGTTVLILFVPWVIAIRQDEQLIQEELEPTSLLY